MAPTHEVGRGRNSEHFSRFEGLTFDIVVLLPRFSDVLPDIVDATSWFTPTFPSNMPLLSATSDKITEGRSAIAVARCGGISVGHRNLAI